MERNGCVFYCGKCSLLSGSLKNVLPIGYRRHFRKSSQWKSSSISLHLARQPTSQLMHCCLLTAGLFFSSALSTPSVGWRRTLYSTWLLLSLLSKQGNFSCPTPVASELFLHGATSSPVVDGACIGISSSSCQMRTEKHLPLVFKTQVLPRTLCRCFMSLLVFFAPVSLGVN